MAKKSTIQTLTTLLVLTTPTASFSPIQPLKHASTDKTSTSLHIFGEAFNKAFEEEGPLGKGITVGKLQIALSLSSSERSSPTSILRLLEDSARDGSITEEYDDESYDYGGDSHLSQMCHATCLALMRKSDDWVGACSESRWFKSEEGGKAESLYNQWADREAAKFEKTKQLSMLHESVGDEYVNELRQSVKKEYIPDEDSSTEESRPTIAVISLIIEIQGDSTLFSRAGFSISETKDCLSSIMSDCRVMNGDCLNAVEVFWTPSDNNEVLTERDTVLDFPELISF
ncbi:hypothetical protein ACHAXN_004557 [Cyclotella atomus]